MRSEVGFLLLAALATANLSCDSDSPGPDLQVDALEAVLEPTRPLYPVHDTMRAVAIATTKNGDRVRLGGANWRSLDPTVATVDREGLIRVLAPGTATIEGDAFGYPVRLQFLVRGLLHFDHRIDSSETWMAVDTPHVVLGIIAVGHPVPAADTVVLTIEPGRVLFRPESGLVFGNNYPGRLVTTGNGLVSMEGDSADNRRWVGLEFHGPGRSELRNVSMQHCGGRRMFDAEFGCITASAKSMEGPALLLEDVTITGAAVTGMALGNFVTIVPGSRNLSIVDGDGHIATISPELVEPFPRGGRFEGNAENAIWIGTGLVRDSTTWLNPGVPLRLVGGVTVQGPAQPYLTLPAGLLVRSDPGAMITLGKNTRSGLRVGDNSGPPTVLESTGDGWGGIDFSDGSLPSSLIRVEIRDCGGTDGGCLRVRGGAGTGTRLHVEDVSIRDSRGIGIQLSAEARFDATSANLTITGSRDAPVEMPAEAVPSLPQGNYRLNGQDVIRLRWGQVTRTATWRNPGVPFLAPEGLGIGSDGSTDPVLTLEPGVVLQLGTGTRVAVGLGALRALGTEAEPVLFTSATPGVPGSWMGVELGTAADARTRLDHVEIQDAGAGDPGVEAGALRLQADPGGVLRNSRILRSSSCGVILFTGSWAEDYADPAFGNSFTAVTGPPVCVMAP